MSKAYVGRLIPPGSSLQISVCSGKKEKDFKRKMKERMKKNQV